MELLNMALESVASAGITKKHKERFKQEVTRLKDKYFRLKPGSKDLFLFDEIPGESTDDMRVG